LKSGAGPASFPEMLRTLFTAVVLLLATICFGGMVVLAQLFGVSERPGSIYEKAPLWWAKSLLWAAGVKVVRHGGGELAEGAPRVFIANRELEKIPLFGAAARGVGVIYIDRENRKAAFSAYEDAAKKIQQGRSVLVYPEGTRGDGYALRQFKKGPFVLAIGSGAPIVPVVIHGTIEVNPRGEFRASPGTVHVHLLEPIPTEGLTYADREQLGERVRLRMAECLEQVYAVHPALETRTSRAERRHAESELSPMS
jgi:1-acyl-sn-glycerol-3-phosphate acyltransferase